MASTAVTKFGKVRAKAANASMSTTLMVGLAGDSVYNSCSTNALSSRQLFQCKFHRERIAAQWLHTPW